MAPKVLGKALAPLIKSKILLFADDLKIFLKVDTFDHARQLQQDINIIIDWCAKNNLQLNVSKCHVMSFTRRHLINLQYFNYNINGISLARVNTVKDLDQKLTFEAHVNNITNKAYRTLGFISRSLNKFKNVNTYKILYYTYIRSGLEYGTVIWNPHYRNQIESIERVQRRFTRTLYRKFHYPAEKNYLMRNVRLDLLTLEDRRTITDEVTLFKIHSGGLKTELNNQLHWNRPVRTTRHNNNSFYLPFVMTNVEYFAPLLRMQRKHDELFAEIDLNETNLYTFKRYTTHAIKNNQLVFDYSFENP